MLRQDPLRHRQFARPIYREHGHAPSPGIGVVVFIALFVLTVVEYAVAISLSNNLVPLIVFALLKGGLIVYYFMHVMAMWREKEEE